MSESSQERREPATQKRRADARKKGQVFRSAEMTAAFALLGGMGALALGAGRMLTLLRGYLVTALASRPISADLTPQTLGGVLSPALTVAVQCCLPVVAGAAALGLAADYAQVGFIFSGEPMTAKFERLDPIAGAKRIFSRRALVEFAKSLAKVGLVAAVAFYSVTPQLRSFGGMALLDVEQAMSLTGRIVWSVVLRTVGALFLVALVDYVYQRVEYERSLRMTREEVKKELRETEGDPQLRGRIRQRQREMARRRMMAAVPKADVVVTNPTHFACALVYRAGETRAPKLVAKGQDYVAVRIKEIARASRVPIVENPPLARTIYATVEIGSEVPPELYRAVAEVLAYVYRLKGKVA